MKVDEFTEQVDSETSKRLHYNYMKNATELVYPGPRYLMSRTGFGLAFMASINDPLIFQFVLDHHRKTTRKAEKAK